MRIEFLGTAGAIVTPRPGCECRVCSEARARGVPYSRLGPAIFVHGPDLLIDTPEEIVHALNRANIRRVGAVTYSHWHPDHTAGVRVFESLNIRTWHWPPQNETTPVYLPQAVKADFDTRRGLSDQLDYLQNEHGLVQQNIVPDGETFTLNSVTVRPFQLPAPTANVCAFLLTEGQQRALIAPDELVGWEPPDWLRPLDVAILPSGLFEFDPFTGERRIPAAHPVLETEATFEQTLAMVRALGAARTFLTHIEEPDGNSYDDLLKLQRKLKAERPKLGSVSFAFDRLSVAV